MGSIYSESKYKLPDVKNYDEDVLEAAYLYLFYDKGEDTCEGYEIELSFSSWSHDEILLSAGFGYEPWSNELSGLLGSALEEHLGSSSFISPKAVEEAVKNLPDMWNHYNCFQQNNIYMSLAKLKEHHMEKLPNIIEFIGRYFEEELKDFLKRYPIEVLTKWNDDPRGEGK